MATTYSTEYNNLYITKPVAKTQRQNVGLRALPFTYTQVLAGTAGDIVYLQQLPPFSQLFLTLSVFYFAGFTAGMTLSIGYSAYTDKDGVLQAASATGLFNAADISNGTGVLQSAMQAVGTPDDQVPAVGAIMKDFQNQSVVDVFATFNDQVPGANAVLNGVLVFSNIG